MSPVRRLVLSSLIAAAGALLPAAGAGAAVTCSYEAVPDKLLTVKGTAAMLVTVNGATISYADADSSGSCAVGGAERLLLTAKETISLRMVTDLPAGASPETGTAELETVADAVGRVAVFREGGAPATWTAGRLGDRRVVSLNSDADADDLTLGDKVTGLQLTGDSGADALRADGNGFGAPIDLPEFELILMGGLGNDTLAGPGRLAGAAGDDTFIARPGITTMIEPVFGGSTPLRMRPDLSGTETGADGSGGTDTYVGMATAPSWVSGTDLPDVLYASPLGSSLGGGGGDDRLYGGDADDRLFADAGSDQVDAGKGDDTVYLTTGGPSTDRDKVDLGPGTDVLSGSENPDEVLARDGEVDVLFCDAGADTGTADAADVGTACEFIPQPVVSVGDITVTEGATAEIPVTLNEAGAQPVSVTVTLADGTATAGADYAGGPPVTVTVPEGETRASVAVPTTGDTADEPDETFTATLSRPQSASLGDASATVTITDVDTPTPSPSPSPSPSPTVAPTVSPAPTPVVARECANGADDDRDGFADARDPQCAAGRGVESPRDNPLLACRNRSLELTEVLPAARGRVRIAGLADPTLAGRTVELRSGRKVIARTKITSTGSFSVTAKALKSRTARYFARTAGLPDTRALRLDRATVGAKLTQSAGRVSISARVAGVRRKGGKVSLEVRPATCGAKFTSVATTALKSSGRFTVRAQRADAARLGSAVAVYRARITLPGGKVSYTLPQVVALG